jgi:hypothetical protein
LPRFTAIILCSDFRYSIEYKEDETMSQIYRPVFSYGKRMAGTAELRHAASAELEIEIRGGR